MNRRRGWQWCQAVTLVVVTAAPGIRGEDQEMVNESARSIPLAYEVDVVVVGGSAGAVAAATLAACFGIVSRVRNSNETEHSGRITKRSTKLGRTTPVQCALIAMRYSPYRAKSYYIVARRRGTGKAVIAPARKFLSVICDTLKYGWVFEDFLNFVITEAS